MVVESNDRSFQECQILKYRRLSPFHVPGQPLRCPTLSVLLITFLLSVISFFHLSVYPHVSSLPHFLLALPLAATSFYSGFPPENISTSVPKTKLPAFPISLSKSFSGVFWRLGPALLMKSRRYYAHAAMCTIYS